MCTCYGKIISLEKSSLFPIFSGFLLQQIHPALIDIFPALSLKTRSILYIEEFYGSADRSIFHKLFLSRKHFAFKITIHEKENEILKRRLEGKRIVTNQRDRKTGLSWKKFLEMHKQSFYTMDFFTVDTILNKRYYVLFFISHPTKEIVRFAITGNPVKEFIRQQLIELSEELKWTVFLLHDIAVQFNLRYIDYMMKGIATSVQAPNMNAIAERFLGSVRREALDHYIILSPIQLKTVLAYCIHYYNSLL